MENETYSLCPVCLRRLPARYEADGRDVYLTRECPEHGPFRAAVWRGAPALSGWLREEQNKKPAEPDTEPRLGCPYDCGLCEQHAQEACCVLLEVTKRCGLGCPLCFASAGSGADDMPIGQFDEVLEFLKAKTPSSPFNLQLSGGEPAERDDLDALVSHVKRAGFPYVQINSNGLRLAAEPEMAIKLRAAGLDCVFLQFDGTDDGIYRKLRGRPLLAIKRAALDNCARAGLPVVLTMALVPGVNTENIGATLDFAMARMPNVRGIHFLPAAQMGRYFADAGTAHFTLPELLRALEVQTKFRLSRADFLPTVSGSCRCALYGNFLIDPDGSITPITNPGGGCCCSRDAVASARAYTARRWGAAYGGEADEWDFFIRRTEERGFSITAMLFMDAWNFDVSRVKKCRFQVATGDQRLIPFCSYYLTSASGERLYADG